MKPTTARVQSYTELAFSKEKSSGVAFPELQGKLNILARYEAMVDAGGDLRYNKMLNGGRINPNDMAMFQDKILRFFDEIRGMIVRQTSLDKMSPRNKRIFSMLVDLEHERRHFSYQELLLMKEYLIDRATNLGILNLLKTTEHHAEEFFQ